MLASIIAATGCATRTGAAFRLPDGPLAMGWRWVPGLQLTYRSLVTRQAGQVRVTRMEEWTYLVRDFRHDAVAVLEGQLTGVGADVQVGQTPLDRTRWEQAFTQERDRSGTVSLEIGMDGRIIGCDLHGFSTTLRHRALGLRLPSRASIPGEQWEDAGLVRSFADLLPARLPVRADGTAEFTGLTTRGGSTIAVLRTQGRIRSPSHGHSIVIHGETDWNADRGLLEHRTLRAVFLPDSTDPIRQPGSLSVEITLI